MRRYLWIILAAFLLTGCHHSGGGPGPILCTPPPGWTAAVYIELNPDVAAAGVEPTKHWCEFGLAEGRPWKKTGPIVPGEIKGFVHLPEWDIPKSCYLSGKRINGELVFGTYGYQDGDHSSEIIRANGQRWNFDSESVMQIKKHGERYYCTVEHGKFKSGVDKGMVFRLDGNTWNEVYRSDHANLAIGLKSHTDGYLYATIVPWDKGNPNSDIVRSKTGDPGTWVKWYSDPYGYRFWFMDSRGSELWIAATSSLADWGGSGQPSVFRNKDLIWRDTAKTGDGFWGVVVYKGDVFLGGTGRARVVRMSDKKTVLDKPNFPTIHGFVIDKKHDILYALLNKNSDTDNAGAEVWATKDGASWHNVGGALSSPLLFGGYYDETTGDIYLYGGRWSQGGNGFGKIYKSVR